MSVALENSIYISDKAKEKVHQLMKDAGVGDDSSYRTILFLIAPHYQ